MRSRRLARALVLAVTVSLAAVLPVTTADAAVATTSPGPAAPVRLVDPFTPLGELVLRGDRVRVRPTEYAAFRVDTGALGAALSDGDRVVTVPDPSGERQRFAIVETSVGEPGFEAKHPEIRTFAGNGIDDPTQSIALDLTPMGFHASVRGPGGQRAWYVDPAFNRRGETRHLSYFGSAVPRDEELFVERDLEDTAAALAEAPQRIGAPDAPVTQKSFRLALVTDPEYAAYFGAANVTAEKATLINRVNQVYMDDLAIKFLLIADNDLLNLDTAELATTAGGPCGADPCFTQADLDGGCTGSLLDQNSFVTGQIVGADSFDIGHIALGGGGGGVAGLGVVGGASKAQGCTGLPTPEGDFFAIDYVAHEIGHQMGGDHTFNGTQRNCSTTNRALTPYSTQVEPGSGSSVMAYAGICQQDNLQPHSDPYFAAVSIEQITDVVADDTATTDEQQVVNLAGFDDADAFTISCAGCATSAPIVNGPLTYNNLTVAQAVSAATGETVTALEIGDYATSFPSLSTPSADGFTVDFTLASGGTDIPELIITPTAGTFTTFTGTIVNGGDTTNEGASTVVANTNPVVTAPADRTLPIRTPFTLTGSGNDADGDPLVYLWEQTDAGGLTGVDLVSNTKTEGPLFRIFGTYADVSSEETLESPSPDLNLATGDPSRTFPDMAQVLADNTNAETGACPAAPAPPAEDTGATNVPIPLIECYSEFLPTAGYAGNVLTAGELNFRLSARDQRIALGGGYAFDDVTLTLGTAGPFLVTSRGTAGAPATAATTENITWDVAGTDSAAYATDVRITLSTDGGATFPFVLAETTANDGIEQITWPDVTTSQARVKVEAVGNYFFDVNDAEFAIDGSVSVSTPSSPSVQFSDAPSTVTVEASSLNQDGDQLTAVVAGLPGVTATRTAASADGVRPGTATFTLAGAVTSAPGTYPTTVTVSQPGGASADSSFSTTVTTEDATATFSGSTAVVGTTPTVPVVLKATIGQAADGSPGDITSASVTFVNRTGGATLCTAPVTGGPTSGTAQCTVDLPRSGPSTTYTVGTVVGGNYVRDDAADDATVTITTEPVADTTPPDTTITSGPTALSFVITRKVTFAHTSTEPGSSFVCTLDAKAVPCGASVRLRYKPGTHVFAVAARDAAGNVDATPATRVFASPFNDGQLTKETTGWKRVKDKAGYRGAYSVTKVKGQRLSRRAAGITKIALVAYTGPRFGRVAIMLGKKRLAVVSLASPQLTKRVLVPVAFSGERSGKVTIVTLDNKEVRIDGLGLLTS